MKSRKWLGRILLVAAIAVPLWFSWPRSLLNITGLRGQTVLQLQEVSFIGLSGSVTRRAETPEEVQTFLSALNQVRFQEELHFSGTITLMGDRIDHFYIWTEEGSYIHFEYSSGGTMAYSNADFSRVFHISGDPAQLTPLFDLVDTWQQTENS